MCDGQCGSSFHCLMSRDMVMSGSILSLLRDMCDGQSCSSSHCFMSCVMVSLVLAFIASCHV